MFQTATLAQTNEELPYFCALSCLEGITVCCFDLSRYGPEAIFPGKPSSVTSVGINWFFFFEYHFPSRIPPFLFSKFSFHVIPWPHSVSPTDDKSVLYSCLFKLIFCPQLLTTCACYDPSLAFKPAEWFLNDTYLWKRFSEHLGIGRFFLMIKTLRLNLKK